MAVSTQTDSTCIEKCTQTIDASMNGENVILEWVRLTATPRLLAIGQQKMFEDDDVMQGISDAVEEWAEFGVFLIAVNVRRESILWLSTARGWLRVDGKG